MEAHPLIDEVTKKAPVAWLTVGDAPAYLVWCLGVDGVLYVVSGPGEQAAPGLAGATGALVTTRGDHGGRVATWPARVDRLQPGTPDWDELAPKLAGKRLNSPLAADALVARWAAECAVHRLVPDGPPREAGPTLPDGSFAAPPVATPATRRPRNPFRLHRVRPRRAGR